MATVGWKGFPDAVRFIISSLLRIKRERRRPFRIFFTFWTAQANHELQRPRANVSQPGRKLGRRDASPFVIWNKIFVCSVYFAGAEQAIRCDPLSWFSSQH